MKKMFRTILFISTFIILFHPGMRAQKLDKIRIKIVETTDVHGALFPFDLIEQSKTYYSLASVATYMRELRADTSQHVLFLDNGDILQGQPVVYYSNFEDTASQHICAKVMNYLKYDAATIGNHDIEAGHAVYDKLVGEFNFPLMAANAVRNNDGKPYFVPYTVFNKGGVKIVVLGIVTPGIPQWLPENLWAGMHFEDMIVSAKYWAAYIKEHENPDLLIGLFHSGTDHTYGNKTANDAYNENASVLVAQQVPGFDLIFTGHDHQEYNAYVDGPNGKKVLVMNAKSYARYAAVVDATFIWNPATDKYDAGFNPKLIDMSQYKPDSAYMETFASDLRTVREYVEHPVGIFTRKLDSKSAIFGPSDFVNFINELQLEITGAEISFAAPLSRNAVIDTGSIKVSDMFKLYKFENLLYTMELSGLEVKNYLEYSINGWFSTMENEDDTLLRLKTDKKGTLNLENPYFNFDAASGIEYSVDVSKPYGQKVAIHKMCNGKEFKLDQTYKVAINSYRGNGGGGHLVQGAGIPADQLEKRIIKSTDRDLRFYMMKWIEKKGHITPKKVNNWQLRPARWVKKAIKREENILFSGY